MEVILVKPLRKGSKTFGKIGDLVKVKDGFGRNYLIPQNFAIRATESNKRLIESQKDSLEQKNAHEKAEAEISVKKIAGKDLIFVRASSDDGKLFGSITGREIAGELAKLLGQKIPYTSVLLDHPIKFQGAYPVEFVLHPEVSASILVVIGRSASEAQDTLRNHKSAESSAIQADSDAA